MPTLEHGGLWSVWDLKGLRPDPGRSRSPAPPATGSVDGRARLACERRGPIGEDASNRRPHATRIDERPGVTRLFPSGEFTAEEATRLLGILARFQADAREASGASAEPRR